MSTRSPNAYRISNLPDNVIDNILSHLPLRDAVKTSILSREWRYKWTFISDLVFERSFNSIFLMKHHIENIVDQVLLHHRGTINKFVFKVPRHIKSLDVDKWIKVLSNHQVHDFTLHFPHYFNYRMPSRFFGLQHLRHLDLCRCVFEMPLGFKRFSQLVSLTCHHVEFTPAIFRKSVSQCSQLETLRLFDCTNLDAIEVEGPKLRFFTFRGLFKSIRFENCYVLVEISLYAPVDDSGEILRSPYPEKYVDFVPTLETVHLPSQMLKDVSFALCLVRSSPNLRMLRIALRATIIDKAVVEYIRVQETPDCHMNQLKKVAIAVFSETESQVDFIAYLLAAAGALEEMVISIPFLPVSRDGGLGFMNKLRQLPRASLNAELHMRK